MNDHILNPRITAPRDWLTPATNDKGRHQAGRAICSPQLHPRPLQRLATSLPNNGVWLRPLLTQFARHTKRRSRRALCMTSNLLAEAFPEGAAESIALNNLAPKIKQRQPTLGSVRENVFAYPPRVHRGGNRMRGVCPLWVSQ